jgi:WD40 repeat protein
MEYIMYLHWHSRLEDVWRGKTTGVIELAESGSLLAKPVVKFAGGEVRIWNIDSRSCVATLSSPLHEKHVDIICVSIVPDQNRISCRMNRGDGVRRVVVWDLSTSEGQLKGYEQLLGCRNEFGFEITSAA